MKGDLLTRTASLLVLIVIGSTSLADEDRQVTLTASYVSEDNHAFGLYQDITETGWRGDVALLMSGENQRWRLSADTLGRFVQFEWRGALDIEFGYNEILSQYNDSGRTPFSGEINQRLPAGWVGGPDTLSFSPALVSTEASNGLQRKIGRLSTSYRLTPSIVTSVTLSREEKTGARIEGGVIYFNAANPQAVQLSVPVDQKVMDLAVETLVEGPQSHVALGFRVLDFDNRIEQVSWQNPYVSGLGTGVDYPSGSGGISGAPDYEFREYSLDAGVRLGKRVRLAVRGAVGESEQQSVLAGYTVNAALASAVSLPVTQLDEPLATAKLQLSGYFLIQPRLKIHTHYRFSERENRSARLPWQYVRGDGADQPSSAFSVYNRPLDYTREEVEIRGIYRLPSRVSVRLQYESEDEYRSHAAVTDLDEETLRLEVRSPSGPISSRISAEVANRAGSTYEWSRSLFHLLHPELISQIPDDQRWISHPELRQFHLANREISRASWLLSYQPDEDLLLQTNLRSERVIYDRSSLGLTMSEQTQVSLHMSYALVNDMSLGLQVDYSHQERDQTGRDFAGGIQKPANVTVPPFPQGSDETRNYQVHESNETLSGSLMLKWEPTESLAVDLVFSRLWHENSYGISNGGARDLMLLGLPETESALYDVDLTANYSFSGKTRLDVAYRHYRFTTDDWRVEGIRSQSVSKLLTTGEFNPDEQLHFFSLAITHEF